MVLSDECDLDAIGQISKSEGWSWELAAENKKFFETGYIFRAAPKGLSS
jgi:hypothetical protein